MATSSMLSSRPPLTPTPYHQPRFHLHSNFLRSSSVVRASPTPSPLTSSQGTYRGVKPQRDWISEWISENDGFVRIMPILVGGVSLVAVLLNRAFSGIAPVADASSSQSRADILTLSLAVTDILTGLVWLSIRPNYISPVAPSGVECKQIKPGIPNDASQSYLANLSLYPGRSELPFLPNNTQALILQPIGDRGIAIIGGDTIRGFTATDQAWISIVAEKLDATLSKFSEALAEA